MGQAHTAACFFYRDLDPEVKPELRQDQHRGHRAQHLEPKSDRMAEPCSGAEMTVQQCSLYAEASIALLTGNVCASFAAWLG